MISDSVRSNRVTSPKSSPQHAARDFLGQLQRFSNLKTTLQQKLSQRVGFAERLHTAVDDFEFLFRWNGAVGVSDFQFFSLAGEEVSFALDGLDLLFLIGIMLGKSMA